MSSATKRTIVRDNSAPAGIPSLSAQDSAISQQIASSHAWTARNGRESMRVCGTLAGRGQHAGATSSGANPPPFKPRRSETMPSFRNRLRKKNRWKSWVSRGLGVAMALVRVLVSVDVKASWIEAAVAEGLNLSDWVRRACRDAREVEALARRERAKEEADRAG